jgi:hypothetical protein
MAIFDTDLYKLANRLESALHGQTNRMVTALGGLGGGGAGGGGGGGTPAACSTTSPANCSVRRW